MFQLSKRILASLPPAAVMDQALVIDAKLAAAFGEVGVRPEVLTKVRGVLVEAGIPKEHLQHTLSVMLGLVQEKRAEGEAFEPSPQLLAPREEEQEAPLGAGRLGGEV